LSPHIPHPTKIRVYELCRYGHSIFETFFNEVQKGGSLFGHLAGAIRIVEDTSNLHRRPKGKFREIKNTHLECKLYEAKSGIIRIYLIHEENKGRVIIAGGLKDDQANDIQFVIKNIKAYYHEKYYT
jgi:hypothetical protein